MTKGSIKHTAAVGTKFFADGTPRAFPGSSVVSEVTPAMAQYAILERVQKLLATRPFADAFSLLPPPSLHMTLVDLVCDQIREPAHWSTKIPLDTPLEMVDRRMTGLLAKVPFPHKIGMRFDHIERESTICTVLVPADGETICALTSFRDAVAEATGVRHPNHETYFFHISLAYVLRELDVDERSDLDSWLVEMDALLERDFGVLELALARLVFFPDMHSFPSSRPRGR